MKSLTMPNGEILVITGQDSTFPNHKNDPVERREHRDHFVCAIFFSLRQEEQLKYNDHLNIRALKKFYAEPKTPRMDRPFADSLKIQAHENIHTTGG